MTVQFPTCLAPERGSARVRARGDIDVATRDELREAALSALNHDLIRQVVIDLASVTFLDASGLGSLVAIRNASDLKSKRLVLANIPAPIARLLELTDLLQHFTVAALPDDDDISGPDEADEMGL